MKLELKHLVGYLPYELKGISKEEYLGIETIKGFSTYGRQSAINIITTIDDIDMELFKPILRPLSDLVKEIEVNGDKFVPIEYFEIGDDNNYSIDFGNGNTNLIKDLESISKHKSTFDIQFLPKIISDKLIEWHFDIYGLIEAGLAISIHDITQADA